MVQRDVTGATIWLLAVLGAGLLLVAPITPWLIPVELVGVTVCLVATTALVVRLVRR